MKIITDFMTVQETRTIFNPYLGNCELSIRSRYCNAKNRTSLAFQYQRIRRHNIECSQEIANLIKNAILTLFFQDFMTKINTAMH